MDNNAQRNVSVTFATPQPENAQTRQLQQVISETKVDLLILKIICTPLLL